MHDIESESSHSVMVMEEYKAKQCQEPLSLINQKLPALSRYYFLFLFLCISTCLAFHLSGCVTANPNIASEPIALPQDNSDEVLQNTLKINEQLEKENRALAENDNHNKELIADLQLSLLDKHREADNYLQTIEHLLNEVLRNKSEVIDTEQKISTANLIVEVIDIIIGTLKRSNLDSRQKDLLYWAERYLAESAVEVQRNNYEGALYLCRQAMDQLQQTSLFLSSQKVQGDNEEITFLSPLPMKILKKSNFRNGPSIKAKVNQILEAGSLVTALGYKGKWVRVCFTKQGNVGWIHFSLLH